VGEIWKLIPGKGKVCPVEFWKKRGGGGVKV